VPLVLLFVLLFRLFLLLLFLFLFFPFRLLLAAASCRGGIQQLELVAVLDLAGHQGLVALVSWSCLKPAHNLNAVNDPPEHNVLAIQKRRWLCCDEKLRPICVWPTVCHAEQEWLVVL